MNAKCGIQRRLRACSCCFPSLPRSVCMYCMHLQTVPFRWCCWQVGGIPRVLHFAPPFCHSSFYTPVVPPLTTVYFGDRERLWGLSCDVVHVILKDLAASGGTDLTCGHQYCTLLSSIAFGSSWLRQVALVAP